MAALPPGHARTLVQTIFRTAKTLNADSGAVALALADALAVCAATVTLDGSAASRASLDDRLDSFVAHVRARYPQVLQDLVEQSTRQPQGVQ